MSSDCVVIVNSASEASHLQRQLEHQCSDVYFEWNQGFITKQSLSRLCISNCNISTCQHVADNFTSLLQLNVASNALKDLTCISSLNKLELLDISHNKLESLSFAVDMKSLSVLRCHNNRIESLEHLKSCSAMIDIWLSNNKIPWVQFIFLSTMKNLQSIVKCGNPADEKSKFDEYVQCIIPSLKMLDGALIATGASNNNNNMGKMKASASGIGCGDDVHYSTDIKVMITQARGQLLVKDASTKTSHERMSHRDSKYQSSSSSSSNTSNRKQPQQQQQQQELRQQSVDDLSISTAAGDLSRVAGALVGKSQNQRRRPGSTNSNNDNTNSNITSTSGKTEKSEEDSSILNNNNNNNNSHKASKQKKSMVNKHRKAISVAAAVNNQQSSANSNSNGVAMAADDASAQGNVMEKCIKFGNTDDAPVACCAYSNGDGYIKWDRKGVMACSLDRGRIFSSHQNGCIAAVFDHSSGNGSFMNNKGHCLLMISDHTTASVLDKNGGVSETYRCQQETSVLLKQRSARGEFNIPDPEPRMYGGKDSASKTEVLMWKFDNLQLCFDTVKWEVVVIFRNDVSSCRISSNTGISEVKEEKGRRTKSNKKSSGNGSDNGRISNSDDNNKNNKGAVGIEEHQEMRGYIQAITDNLSATLRDMQTKPLAASAGDGGGNAGGGYGANDKKNAPKKSSNSGSNSNGTKKTKEKGNSSVEGVGNHSNSDPSSSSSYTASDSQHEHEHIRSGIIGINSGLDSMLADMKNTFSSRK